MYSPEHLSGPRHPPRSRGVCRYLSAPAAGPPLLWQHVVGAKDDKLLEFRMIKHLLSIDGSQNPDQECSLLHF